MPTLLHIDSSPLYGQIRLPPAYRRVRHRMGVRLTKWNGRRPRPQRQFHPACHRLDWVAAAYTPAEARTSQQKEVLALSDTLFAELQQADEFVFGVPMHNFGVPSVLKLWIDQIARVGKAFSYADGKPKGLLTGKKATFIIATGGIYDPQTQMASFNFVEPYLRSVFGFLGVTDVTFLTAGGTAALNYGQDRDAFLAPHLQAVQTHAHAI